MQWQQHPMIRMRYSADEIKMATFHFHNERKAYEAAVAKFNTARVAFEALPDDMDRSTELSLRVDDVVTTCHSYRRAACRYRPIAESDDNQLIATQ